MLIENLEAIYLKFHTLTQIVLIYLKINTLIKKWNTNSIIIINIVRYPNV